MPRFTRLRAALVAALVTSVAALPAPAWAQLGTSERRPAPASQSVPLARRDADPWLDQRGITGSIAGRANLTRIDQALAPYDVTYARLAPQQRAQLRAAFAELLPGESFTRYRLRDPQARAIAYLALGAAEPTDCDGSRRRRGPARCGQALDSMSRDAAWIHTTILALGRTGSRRPRAEELADLRSMTERARAMVVTTPGCGCTSATADAEALLTSTRQALDAYEGSSMAAWMSIGSSRVQRISQLSDTLERTYIRCLNGTAD